MEFILFLRIYLKSLCALVKIVMVAVISRIFDLFYKVFFFYIYNNG